MAEPTHINTFNQFIIVDGFSQCAFIQSSKSVGVAECHKTIERCFYFIMDASLRYALGDWPVYFLKIRLK